MERIPLTYDLSGFSYDADYPTREMEALAYRLNSILDDLKDNEVELRNIEPQDITDLEAFAAALFEAYKTPPEEAPALETPENTDMLLDTQLYQALTGLRTAWLARIAEKVDGVDETTRMGELVDIAKAMLNQESVLYLSDGTPIYGKTGLIA